MKNFIRWLFHRKSEEPKREVREHSSRRVHFLGVADVSRSELSFLAVIDPDDPDTLDRIRRLMGPSRTVGMLTSGEFRERQTLADDLRFVRQAAREALQQAVVSAD